MTIPGSTLTVLRRIAILAVIIAAAFWVLPTVPASAVSSVDISPGWQNAGTDGYDCWSLSAQDTTSSTDFKFSYGDGSSVTYTNVGGTSWYEFSCHGFGVQCTSINFGQFLDHLNGAGSDSSTTYVPGTSPC